MPQLKKSNRINKYYAYWKHLIQEGDVLLFRGSSFYSRFLRISGDSPYTHVGLASWHNDVLECVEFHEKHGGRSVNLENYIKLDNRIIDVHRPVPFFASQKFNLETSEVDVTRIPFDGTLVTDELRSLTGLPYGWKRICWIACHKLGGLRFFYNPDTTSTDSSPIEEVIYPVCSTAVAYCFSQHDFDLVSNKADEWTEPGHIANSTRLHKLFTIKEGVLTIVD